MQEYDVKVTAKKHGKGILNGKDVLLKDEIHSGSQINITRKSKFIGFFFCSFDNLPLYPFDTETCSMDLKIKGSSYKFLSLK